jgi:hypothetical protein
MRRRQELMVKAGAPVSVPLGQTMGARAAAGAKMPGAVAGHQGMLAQNPALFDHARRAKLVRQGLELRL